MKIWIVTYFDEGDIEATVTAFSNKEAAQSCLEAFEKLHTYVSLNEVPVYSSFLANLS